MLEGLDKDEQNRVKINSILHTIGVDSDEVAETLLGYFLQVNGLRSPFLTVDVVTMFLCLT